MFKKIAFTIFFVCLTVPAFAINMEPGKGITIRPARATWSTGYFHALLVEKGLKELGYTVKKPKELPVALFYKTLSLGDVDYWANAWLPLQNNHLERFKDTISPIGYVLEKQALQGYMVDKKHADALNITSLEDFKRPEVRKAFDKDGDGKADLTGAPHGWESVKVIKRHLEEYGLKEHVEQVSASYEAGMAANIAAFNSGEPIFYYTWTPSWTIYKLKPGEDVVWINVPFNIPTSDDKDAKKLMRLSDVDGAATNPIDMGFSVADIRVVANNKFLEQNPPARKFLELFTINISDLSTQYAKLMEGEKSPRDIERHANQWIENNQDVWNSWLDQARRVIR